MLKWPCETAAAAIETNKPEPPEKRNRDMKIANGPLSESPRGRSFRPVKTHRWFNAIGNRIVSIEACDRVPDSLFEFSFSP